MNFSEKLTDEEINQLTPAELKEYNKFLKKMSNNTAYRINAVKDDKKEDPKQMKLPFDK